MNYTLSNVVLAVIAVVLVAAGAMIGLFSLAPMPLLGNALVAVLAVYMGVVLGRRSSSANQYADRITARLRAAEAKLREHGISLPR